MPINCPLGNKDSHSCWWCLFGSNNQSTPTNKICNHPDYDKPKSYKVKPKRVLRVWIITKGR